LKSIDVNEIKKIIETVFPSIFLTLMSIIQGVTLSMWGTKTFNRLFSSDNLDWAFLPYGLLTFLILVIVWHEYMLAALVNRWVPSWCDSLIPFFLGAAEIVLIMFMGDPRWFIGLMVVLVIGALAYLNTYQHVKDRMLYVEGDAGEEMHKFAQKDAGRSVTLSIICAAVTSLFGVGLIFWKFEGIFLWLAFIVVGLIVLIFILIRAASWKKEVAMYAKYDRKNKIATP